MFTPRLASVYRYLVSEIESTGVPPTFAQIAVACGLKSKSQVHQALCKLEERGHIRRLKHRQQAIEIVRPQQVRWFRFDDEEKRFVPFVSKTELHMKSK